MDSLSGFLKLLPDLAIWAAPLIGALVCGVAFLVGRRVFAPVRADRGESPDGPETVYARATPADRRASPRRKGHAVEIQLRLDEADPPLHGWVLDRSLGGLGILSERPVAEGTAVRVRPRSNTEAHPWVDVTIRSCRQDGTYWELGCQFHRTPNWNLLLQFG